MEVLDSSLNYVADKIDNFDFEGDDLEERLIKLGDELAVDVGDDPIRKKQIEYSKHVGSMIEFFMEKWGGIVKLLAYSSPYVTETVINHVKLDDRKKIWKGLLIGPLFKIHKIKKYIG